MTLSSYQRSIVTLISQQEVLMDIDQSSLSGLHTAGAD